MELNTTFYFYCLGFHLVLMLCCGMFLLVSLRWKYFCEGAKNFVCEEENSLFSFRNCNLGWDYLKGCSRGRVAKKCLERAAYAVGEDFFWKLKIYFAEMRILKQTMGNNLLNSFNCNETKNLIIVQFPLLTTSRKFRAETIENHTANNPQWQNVQLA